MLGIAGFSRKPFAQQEELLTREARNQAEELLLPVASTGPGLATEHLHHHFERFYRADTLRDRAEGDVRGSGSP